MMINPEKWKYDKLYSKPTEYGRTNHGHPYLERALKFKSILDVGCGYNDFLKEVRDYNKTTGQYDQKIWSIGVDFSCPGADELADILHLPFKDNSFELVTAFDVWSICGRIRLN